jgi:hypothetical protein
VYRLSNERRRATISIAPSADGVARTAPLCERISIARPAPLHRITPSASPSAHSTRPRGGVRSLGIATGRGSECAAFPP